MQPKGVFESPFFTRLLSDDGGPRKSVSSLGDKAESVVDDVLRPFLLISTTAVSPFLSGWTNFFCLSRARNGGLLRSTVSDTARTFLFCNGTNPLGSIFFRPQ